ncbi:MAG: tetratricopeptide repeat protein [bacterium]
MIILILFLLLPSELYKEAHKAYKSGDFELAGKRFERLLVNYPDNVLAPEAMFWTAKLKSNPDKAMEYYTKFISLYPESNFVPEALYNIAQYYYAVEDYNSAIKFYNDLTTKYPSSVYTKYAYSQLKIFSTLIYIQIGAFSTKENALKLQQEITPILSSDSLLGNELSIQINQEANLYKIKIGHFNSELEASEFLLRSKINGFVIKRK